MPAPRRKRKAPERTNLKKRAKLNTTIPRPQPRKRKNQNTLNTDNKLPKPETKELYELKKDIIFDSEDEEIIILKNRNSKPKSDNKIIDLVEEKSTRKSQSSTIITIGVKKPTDSFNSYYY